MRRPWLDWNPKRFLWTVLPATLGMLALFDGLLRLVGQSPVRFVIHVLYLLVVILSGYVTFTWAAEQDRRNPPWERKRRRRADRKGG